MAKKRKIRKAIVTGGAGFIGSHLVDRLISDGVTVVIIDNLSSGSLGNLFIKRSKEKFAESGSQIIVKDVREDLTGIFKEHRPDTVFHLAAIAGVVPSVKHPIISNAANVGGTLSVLEASRKANVGRVVFSSSSSVYGGAAPIPTKERSFLNPMSPYALQKKIGEDYCELYSSALYGLDTICLRYFNVFGPRQRADSPYAAVIPAFCEALKNKERPTIFGDGEQSRDFCYVDNVVNANLLAARSGDKWFGQAFNVACGKSTTLNQIHNQMGLLPAEYLNARPGDVKLSMADISSIRSALGYEVLYSFEEGLKKTMPYYLE